MIKKTITFEDFDGNKRTEDFYFNLTKAELTDMFNSISGGLDKKLDQIVKAKDAPKIMAEFRDILKASYGVKSLDGRTFRKSEDIFAEFQATEAYSELYMELCTDSKAAAAFIQGILPADLSAEAAKEAKKLLLAGGDDMDKEAAE